VNTRKFWQLSRLGILTVIIALSVTALGSLALAAGSSFFQGLKRTPVAGLAQLAWPLVPTGSCRPAEAGMQKPRLVTL
jgi:hypothetical protein